MKAMVYSRYGPPEVLQLKEVEKPAPKDDEVLVEVRAASINYGDVSFVRGQPFVIRLMGAGLLKPKYPILGSDVAGRIESVGAKVQLFQPGDEVFGQTSDYGWGGFADYVALPECGPVLKPAHLTFEEAAAVPQPATVALQGLRDEGGIQGGQKVLIVGASGGIGTFAVQIAKSFGAEVTGVCSTRNVDMVRSLGADRIVDYKKEDFAQGEQRYDLIVATAGYRSIFDYRRALSPDGTYVMIGGSMAQIYQAMFLGPLLSRKGAQKLVNLAAGANQDDLMLIKALIEAGEVTPVIDRCYPLGETVDALRYYGEGHARGKVVITVNHNSR